MIPIDRGGRSRQSWGTGNNARQERDPITMLAIIALVIAAIIALVIISAAVHVLFSPLVLLLVVVGIVGWIKFRPRSHR